MSAEWLEFSDLGHVASYARLQDTRKEFSAFLDLPNPPPLVHLAFGEVGSGKTNLCKVLLEEFHDRNDKRCAFWGLSKATQEYLAKNGQDWFYPVINVNQVMKKDMLYVDEGILFLNSNMSHSEQVTFFGQLLALSRQKDHITLGGVQRQVGIAKVYRDFTNILYIKRLSVGYLNEVENLSPVMKRYAHQISMLRDDQAMIVSYASKYLDLNKYGGVGLLSDIPLSRVWSEDEISKMHQDFKIGKEQIPIDILRKIAAEAYSAGMRVNNMLKRDALVEWLRVNKPETDLSNKDCTTIRQCLSYIQLNDESKDKRGSKEEPTTEEVPINGNTFEKWVLVYMSQLGYDGKQIEVLELTFQRIPQTEIRKSVEMSQPWVSTLVSGLKKGKLGHWYEDYFRGSVGDTRKLKSDHREADAVASDNTVYSVKYSLEDRTDSQLFDPVYDCVPEMEYCKANKIPTFVLHYYNSLWKHKSHFFTIEVANTVRKSFKDEKDG